MSMVEPRDLMDVLARLEQATRAEFDGPTRRHFKRFQVREDAVIEAIDGQGLDDARPVLLRDISLGGVGFLVDRPFDPGTLWRMRFLCSGQLAGSQPIVVRFCRLVQDNLYLAGGQFVVEPIMMRGLGVSAATLQDDHADDLDDYQASRFLRPDDPAV